MLDANDVLKTMATEMATKYIAAQLNDVEPMDDAHDVLEHKDGSRIIITVTAEDKRVSFWANRESGGDWFNLEFRNIDDLVSALEGILD